MKRSMGQELPAQGTSTKMSRHDHEDIEKTETPTTNIFLVETILRRLFKQIESVSKLKELRKICQLWDKVDTEELEERAFKGRIKSIDLTFSKKVSREFKPLIKAQSLEMRGFLDDTSSNPGLFRSFALIFPCSLAHLNLYKFRWFYKDYSPTFLELTIPTVFQCNQDKELLLKGLLRWAAPTLRELVLNNIYGNELIYPTRKSLPVQSFNFPHLRKVNTRFYGSIRANIVDLFKVIFTKENHPETPSLASLRLQFIYPFDFLDLNSNPSRWASLTMLEIECRHNYRHRWSHFSDGLLSLARAGMTLKKLDLGLNINHVEVDPVPFRNMSRFFASQAGSLEALKLKINLDVSIEEDQEGQIQIKLPVFERLHTLSLDLNTRVNTNGFLTRNIFEFGSISQHFPALENLNILNFVGSLDGFFGGSYPGVEERLDLKRIAICRRPYGGYNYNGLHFDKCFAFVEAFSCSQYALNDLRILGDLVDTVRVLYLRDVYTELDLSQFKGLRRVVIEEEYKSENMHRKVNEHYDRYLSYFQKIMDLGLESIMFRGLDMLGKEEEFAEAFPFRAEFEEKPVDWVDEDFIDN